MFSNISEEPRDLSATVAKDPALEEASLDEEASNNEAASSISRHERDLPIWSGTYWSKGRPPGEEDYEMLLNPLLDQDNKQCNVWKEEVQNILILAGLFSAVVTAFIIESYQTLQPDPNDKIISLLSRIADQITTPNGSAHLSAASLATNAEFIPSPSSVRVNIFWFISLVLSLAVALIGIITLQWLREHQRYDSAIEAGEFFAIFNARSEGLKRWYVPEIFTGLPLLLEAALLLFFAGLVDFLFSIHIDVAILVSVAVAIPILFLGVTTLLPTLQLCALQVPYLLRVNNRPPAPCPYKSPQALILQRGVVVSSFLFGLIARAFGILWIPFVVIIRVFVRSDKPFYGKSAPFRLDDYHYQDICSRLRKSAGSWMSMDLKWLAVRTSYAVVIHTPSACRHLRWPYVDDYELNNFLGFYDLLGGIKNTARKSDPLNVNYRECLQKCIHHLTSNLAHAWTDPLKAASSDPAVSKALQAHITALIHIIVPGGQQQTENLVRLSRGDKNEVFQSFHAVLMDQAMGYEFDFNHQGTANRLSAHFSVTKRYLFDNAHELFMCSNHPGITPYLSPSTRRSLLHHRKFLERDNADWMDSVSHHWTNTLQNVIINTRKMIPVKPFTRKCAGSSTARCGSNLHTKSITQLTEYILLFQVPEDIQATLRLLVELCKSKPNPVQERPFVLIIACAYINAVANVNQDDVGEFRTLLDMICELCGSLDATLDTHPFSKGRYWPSMESAFDYIRNNREDTPHVLAVPVPQPPEIALPVTSETTKDDCQDTNPIPGLSFRRQERGGRGGGISAHISAIRWVTQPRGPIVASSHHSSDVEAQVGSGSTPSDELDSIIGPDTAEKSS